jgi:hypothetical protein
MEGYWKRMREIERKEFARQCIGDEEHGCEKIGRGTFRKDKVLSVPPDKQAGSGQKRRFQSDERERARARERLASHVRPSLS